MKPTSSLRESVAYTHDPAAVDDVPAWAGEGFEWTIPRRHRRAGGGA